MLRFKGLLFTALIAFGCDDNDSAPLDTPPASKTTQSGSKYKPQADAGTEPSEPDCYENPRTHLEIINACTDALKVSKKPDLKLLNDDGSLPAP